jgi:GTP pyrophosphokinase
MTSLSNAQIDRLGDRLRGGALSEHDLRMLDEYRRSFGEAHETVVKSLRERLHLEPTGRPAKSTTSLVEKLRRESIRLVQVQDIAGCRGVIEEVGEQERVLGSILQLFPEASVVDRRAAPSYGYRAVHIVVRVSGKLVEIQVRTLLQHLWADVSEGLSDILDPEIKYGGGDDVVRKALGTTSEMVAKLEDAEMDVLNLEREMAGLNMGQGESDLTPRLQVLRAQLAQQRKELREQFDRMIVATEKKRERTS